MSTKFLNLFILICAILLPANACGPGRGIGGPRRSRKIYPLVFKQHVPNVSENTLGASGSEVGKISRHDPRFRDLVPNYNKDIIFKDEEGSGADRLMSQRCKEKLNILSVSVMNEWPGIRLRVTEGWDEEGVHGRESLHYEGRAVDITTSDRDRGKNGMLARLAVEAGFDWVYYESRAHVHCSVKSDSAADSHTSGCFTANSTVQTSTGETRKLSELKIGEKVLSIDTVGNVVYSEVLMFLDRNVEQKREFVTIETEDGAIIRTTPAHLLMVWKSDKSSVLYEFSSKVEEGDFLLVNENSTLVPSKVLRISTEIHRGVFAPLTAEGTIIVNSVSASCYAMVNSQWLAHWSFTPIRAVNRISHWWRRSSDDYTNSNSIESHQRGLHWYAQSLYSIKDYLLPTDWVYHT